MRKDGIDMLVVDVRIKGKGDEINKRKFRACRMTYNEENVPPIPREQKNYSGIEI